MSNNTHTLNLTPIFVVWSLIFVVLALATGDYSLFVWAAAPWLVLLAFGIAMFLFAGLFMWSKYRQGERIKVTTRKGVRYVQRGREPQWVVRNTAGR